MALAKMLPCSGKNEEWFVERSPRIVSKVMLSAYRGNHIADGDDCNDWEKCSNDYGDYVEDVDNLVHGRLDDDNEDSYKGY